jgi:hypothetical protein
MKAVVRELRILEASSVSAALDIAWVDRLASKLSATQARMEEEASALRT